MKLVKSLLLGSAAGLVAAAGVQAADLPARTVAPVAVDYVRVCSTYGAGFFYIPGSSETCLRVGGRVRADVIYVEPFTRADNAIQFLARGRVQLDARTATSYGLLRAFVRMEMTRTGAGATSPNIAQAFIQFGGLTAGRVTSFFSNPDLPTQHMSTLRFDDSPENNLFAYTFNFGGGFSATISAEEGQARRSNNFAALTSFGSGTVFRLGGVAGPVVFQNPYSLVYGGQTVPDIVGNIRMAGTWGSVQLSGALHQIRDVGVSGGRMNAFTGTALPAFADTEYGWALMGSAGFNLPALGQGDAVWIAATYSTGAASYSGFGDPTFFNTSGVVDATINPITGDIDKTDIWTVAGGFTHYWTPQLRTSVFGSYARVEAGGNPSFVAGLGTVAIVDGATKTVLLGANTGLADFTEWRIGANTFWSPVSGLNIGVEVLYAEADYKGLVARNTTSALGSVTRLSGDVGAIEGRLRIQRDF